MLRVAGFMVAGITGYASVVVNPPVARADDLVTYEVISDQIGMANIEYQDSTGRIFAQNIVLPWRADATVHAARDAPPDGSQVRADWRPVAGPSKWVTVRISYEGKVICESTLDVGDATCYGITPHFPGRE
ncbi:hypothetical protein [Mycobacterium sp. DL440]|uniref:hypothetical protein n=1 Tax=Mycobacterium sp. DL440 TaxID=2675523 RepID=UPI001AAE4636|nr:hypothetical protein [Mycobacterium sp. DL440]